MRRPEHHLFSFSQMIELPAREKKTDLISTYFGVIVMEKSEIRPLYSEFQGYLSQIPQPKSTTDVIDEESVWNRFNRSIDKLIALTNDQELARFRIQPIREYQTPFIRAIAYRQSLGGLISYLHGKYFSDETPPFSGMPSTVIHQSQYQHQSIQLVLEFQEQIINRMADYPEGSKEKKFLQKIKDSLSSISSWIQLLTLVYKSAKDFGLDIDSVGTILGLK